MNRVLVIIDNIIQYERIKILIKAKGRIDVQFDFRHSSVKSEIWEHEDFKNFESFIVDVKQDIDYILANFDLVISVHCFQYFPKELLNQIRCINVHPGYNPVNRGWFPQVFSIVHDLPIGATIHEIDQKLDHGAIIARKLVTKYNWDTSLDLYNRVLEAEIELLNEHFDEIIDNSYIKTNPENEGNIFYKKDFNDLCKIDLAQTGTFKQFYDKLRALSHAEYKNAYFVDKDSGKKIFIKLEIDPE